MYKDDYKLNPAQVSICLGVASIPWVIKPLWGATSDNFYLFGYRRKSYLIFFGFIQCVSWLILAHIVNNYIYAVCVLIVIQVGVAFCNVIAEALLVEISRDCAL